jgi:hypothetical protein
MFGLLINPRPHQDESLLGYLQRLAKANGLPRKELLTAFARADETDVADWLQMMEGPLSWPAVSAEFRDPRPKGSSYGRLITLVTVRSVWAKPVIGEKAGA